MKKITLFFAVAFAVLFFNAALLAQINNSTPLVQAVSKREKFAELIEKANRRGEVRVIVGLKTGSQSGGVVESTDDEKQRRIKVEQNKFLGRHAGRRLEKIKKYDFAPLVAFAADAPALDQMQSDEEIEFIEEDELSAPSLAESTALIGAVQAWNMGFSGSGQAIAILDTGVDKNHPFLSGKIVSEACYSSNYTDATSFCPGAVTESTAANSGLNCTAGISGCAHGTHVAGIAAGRGGSFSGVARDANIIAIQVFSSINNAEDCGSNPAPCALSYTSDQLKALERVRVLSGTMKIAAVNMSLGGGQYADNCDAVSPSRKAVIDALRAAGVATVVSSGNNGYTSAISAPACVSSAVSVGSTDDGSYSTTLDGVSSFSNSSPQLTLLAPGKYITSSVLNGGYGIYAGTSMAAPHVAGAFAVLKQKKPTAGVTELLAALTSTGKAVTDSRNNVTKPRIQIDRALVALDGPAAVRRPLHDYDGDGRADIAVFRPSSGVWYVQNSATNTFSVQQFGLPGDLAVPADYDGDGKTDIAVFRPSTGTWYWARSTGGGFSSAAFGTSGDVPAPADFDGDGKADPAVFRPSGGVWWILKSRDNSVASQQFGVGEDKPAAADYDGDGRADIAVFRPSSGVWFRINSSNNQAVTRQFGLIGDKPAIGDYDGDGRADLAVFRPSTGTWYRLNSADNSLGAVQFGLLEDKPAAADYDGDGRADLAVYRPNAGTWYLQRSTAGLAIQQFGIAEDVPSAGALVR